MLEALRVDDHALVRLADCADPETRRVDYLAAQELCRDGQLVCPACALFGAKGEIYPRRDTGPGHWAHHPRGDKGCPRYTEPMSVAHYLAQLHIQQTLRTRYPQANVELETRLGPGQSAGRGDITVQLADGRQLCIEVQRSKMSPGHVQQRIQNREAAGWAIDWVFIIEAEDLDWSKPLAADSMLRTALERRGYIYLLEDPYAPDPSCALPSIATSIDSFRACTAGRSRRFQSHSPTSSRSSVLSASFTSRPPACATPNSSQRSSVG
jgi:hypothetical protein